MALSLLGAFVLIFAATIWLGGYSGDARHVGGRALEARLIGAGFVLEHVDVRGAVRTDAAEIARKLMIEPGEVIFHLDPAAAKARVEELRWVREARVLRLLPNRVVVIVDERDALAEWRTENGAVIVDRDGAAIAGAAADAYVGLPLVEGEGAADAAEEFLAAVAKHPSISLRAAAYERVGGRRWDIVTRDGVVVRLPEGAPDAGLARLAELQARDGLLDLPLELVDLRGGGLVLRARAAAPAFERGA